MEAMLRHQQETACLHTTSVVISNKSDVWVLNAKKLDTPVVVVELPTNLEGDARRLSHEGAIEKVLHQYSIELIIRMATCDY